jgi:hypothetical protein
MMAPNHDGMMMIQHAVAPSRLSACNMSIHLVVPPSREHVIMIGYHRVIMPSTPEARLSGMMA